MTTKLPRKPFREHIEELQRRFLWVTLALLFGAVIGYSIRDLLFALLLKPLQQPVYYSSPVGGFDFLLKVCLFFGFLVSLPVLIYHVLRFIEPVLQEDRQKSIFAFTFLSFLFMIVGLLYAYVCNLPLMLHFFTQFSTNQVHALISTDAYVSFIVTDVFGFVIVFQLPLLLLVANQVSPINTAWLLKQEKYIIVAGFLIGAILTPDPINQTIMALPIILLYQLSIALLYCTNHRRITINNHK